MRITLAVILLLLPLTTACKKEAAPVSSGPPTPSPTIAVPQVTVDSANLIPAAAAGDIVKVRELLGAGADVNVRGVDSRTPLMEAAYVGHTEIARLLLNAGANVGFKKDDGETALSFAQGGNHSEIVHLLTGVEHLLVASGKGELERVKELLDQGITVNARGFDGRTALMEASYGGHAEVVKVLLAAGADVTPRKDDGATALSFAEGGRYTDIVGLLRSAGAK